MTAVRRSSLVLAGSPQNAGPAWKQQRHVLVGACLALVAFESLLLFLLAWELIAQAAGFNAPSPHSDFLAFYSAAHFALEGQVASAYSAPALEAFQRLVVPHPTGTMGYMPFLNPPFAAALQAPLAAMPASMARIVWFASNALLGIGVVWWFTRTLSGKKRALASIMVFASFPFYQTLIEGQ